MNHILSSLILLGLLFAVQRDADAALLAGDVAIIGTRADQDGSFPGGDDGFSWVPLVDLAPGQEIFFTDDGWFPISASGFTKAEGTFKYTAPGGGLSAGTVMLLEYTKTAGGIPGSYSSLTPSGGGGAYVAASDANVGGAAGVGFQTAAPGDNIFAFEGPTATPNFLFAWKNEGPFDPDPFAFSNDDTSLPAGLTLGTTALSTSASSDDNTRYAGSTSGTKEDLLALIADPANWEVTDDIADGFPPGGGADKDITNGTLGGGAGGSGFDVEPPVVTPPGNGAVPEPSTLALLGLGSIGLLFYRGRRRR